MRGLLVLLSVTRVRRGKDNLFPRSILIIKNLFVISSVLHTWLLPSNNVRAKTLPVLVILGGWTVILFAKNYKTLGFASEIEPYMYPMPPTRVSCHGSPSASPISESLSLFDNLMKRLSGTFLRWILPLIKGLTPHWERCHNDKFGFF